MSAFPLAQFPSLHQLDAQITTDSVCRPRYGLQGHRGIARIEKTIKRRAAVAGIKTRIGKHTFRATGITAYMKNSGKLEIAQRIANHESPRTTKLYDGRQDEISLDEVERIAI
jgi:hypothetical protein